MLLLQDSVFDVMIDGKDSQPPGKVHFAENVFNRSSSYRKNSDAADAKLTTEFPMWSTPNLSRGFESYLQSIQT